ncbi:MAG: helix-turn-helix domain-containing protein [Gammaproteobacteria bacterium]|nr:helix-turn-helix domain-containing protein [Gammaproteobacteria bacterium]
MDDIAAANNHCELTTKEAASLLGLSPSTLRKWRCTHEHPELTWRKRFRHVFYLESEVILFKEQNTIPNCEETYV